METNTDGPAGVPIRAATASDVTLDQPLVGIAAIKRTVHRILDADARDSALERAGSLFLAVLIIANVAAVILETVESARARFGEAFDTFEAVSVAAFTVEYVLRVLTCSADPRFGSGLSARLRFMSTPLALVDLLAIAPAYVPGGLFWDLRYVRVLRLVRMLRVLKIARYSRTLQLFGGILRAKKDELGLILLFLLVLLVVASSSMYFVEHDAQPQLFSSIPAAMWWAVGTLTTVGYGDIYPITPAGKLLGSVIALIGIGFFALPAGLLASAFAEQLAAQTKRTCPHCGGHLP